MIQRPRDMKHQSILIIVRNMRAALLLLVVENHQEDEVVIRLSFRGQIVEFFKAEMP